MIQESYYYVSTAASYIFLLRMTTKLNFHPAPISHGASQLVQEK